MPTSTRRLAVVSIRTNHLSQTVHFYQEVVGLSQLVHHGHQPAFELGNGEFLVIVESQEELTPPVQKPRFPALAFAVDNLDDEIHRLQAHQIELPWGIESNSQARWVEFYDPGGNLIELAQFNNER